MASVSAATITNAGDTSLAFAIAATNAWWRLVAPVALSHRMQEGQPPTPAGGRSPRSLSPLIARFRGSETGKAAFLAAAGIVTNGVAVIATFAFGRLLGLREYGELNAILSTFLILNVPGAALQVATARDGAMGQLGKHGQFATTLRRWSYSLLGLTIVVTILSVVFRSALASAMGVTQVWAACAVPPTACIWVLLSIQRGALQAIRSYTSVGISMVTEQTARLVLGSILVVAGMGVTGAYLGTPAAMCVTSLALSAVLVRRLGAPDLSKARKTLRRFTWDARVPIAGLALIAVLTYIDPIFAQHRLPKDTAGAYSAASVAAKVVVYVAIVIGFQVVPEAARRHADGQDARPVLMRALAIVGLVAVPCLIIYAAFPQFLMRLAFGTSNAQGADVLFELGLAMALLSVCYLNVQLLLALGEWKFLIGLAVVAVAEPVSLTLFVEHGSIQQFAVIVLTTQAVAAAGSLVMAYRASGPTRRLSPLNSSTVQTPNRATTL